ncbi:HD domain-containing protein [Nocardioides sp.]|uniref:HD domain-containing protein n=1 Tax=Nocardioides sp. TaxID=35761 RepID=UPI003783C9BA
MNDAAAGRPDDLVRAHEERVNALAERLLRPYLSALSGRPSSKQAKEFNDPIWGTLYLHSEEIVVLDSPVLQRLRRIRQLGVGHYVYPAATHTRLEHSLGVVHQVQRMVSSINDRGAISGENGQTTPGDVIDEDLLRVLRMAALCHDVGHGFMSHVSEYALDSNRDCEDLRLQFQQFIQRPQKSQLSEMTAHFLVKSPAFAELIDIAYSTTPRHPPEDLTERMGQLILGRPIDEKVLLLHEFISGPFDADKMDYLARDAMMCGVPNITDIPRLVQKLRATERSKEQLPDGLRRAVKAQRAAYVVTGVAASGGRTLDEIALARTLLFDKVYRHQKVRAVESMVTQIVILLAEHGAGHASDIPFRLSDDQLLELNDDALEQALGRQLVDDDASWAPVVRDLSRCLRDRDLFVRGFAFASVMTGDDYRDDPDQKDALRAFLDACTMPAAAAEFMGEVIQLLVGIADILDQPLPVDPSQLAHYVCLSRPKPAPRLDGSDTGRAHLIEADGKATQASVDAAETSPWADAYIATRDLGHIFCPRQLAHLVYVAAENVVFERFGLRLPSSMQHYAKQVPSEVDTVRRKLQEAGWYDDRPLELRPIPEALRAGDIEDRLQKVVDALTNYQGPARADDAGSKAGGAGSVGRAQVLSYVRQFAEGGDDVVNAALDVLAQVRVIDRDAVVSSLRAFLDSNETFRGASIAPLGSPKDSSAVLTYFVGDLAEEYELNIRSLDQALIYPEPIVLVDDFIGTGRQAVDILQVYMGVERDDPLDEERETLPDDGRALLTTRPVAFVFATGTEAGRMKLEEKAAELGIDATAYVHTSEIPSLDSVLNGHPHRVAFIEFARKKGYEATAMLNGEERDDEWRTERSLGYGNRGLLLTSAFNTPTAATTILWADGAGWVPLMPRRTKR